MIRFLLPFFVFLLFIIEGTVVQVFTPERFGSEIFFVPRFVMVVIVFIAIFLGRTTATFYGIVVGLFYDLIYTDLVGVYLFSMGFVGYVTALTYDVFQRSLFLVIFVSLLGVAILDYLVYGLYTIVGIATTPHQLFLYERLLPSIIFNGVFTIIISYSLRKFLVYLQVLKRRDQQQEEN
ncbi:rod shape-determining protein MreD [Anaerobacillus sp. MEB173]|uniref:rod shape-determining protein MreD n=1 Tax=Anaerobacillus sp. MEB173 TaxID=3383345 RepID=UPI003F8EDBAA